MYENQGRRCEFCVFSLSFRSCFCTYRNKTRCELWEDDLKELVIEFVLKFEKSRCNVWSERIFFLPLQHRSIGPVWAAGGLIYRKDVFERLSLCPTNLANP